MSATLMPGLMPAKAITASASPSRSRASSVEKLSPTIGATSRLAAGKSDLGAACSHAASRPAARTASLVDILDLDSLPGHSLGQGRGHEAVEFAVEHVRWRRRRYPGAQILHQLVRLQHVAADLMAPADVGLGGIGGIG